MTAVGLWEGLIKGCYLGSEVVGVAPLCGCEVGTEHSFRHVDGDH